MTHNHSLFRSLCTQRWTRACSLSPEAPSFWLAFQARPALCMHVFVKVQCSMLGSTLEDKCFSFFSTDWRWQWWRTSNSAVTAFIAKRPRVAYSCSYVLLLKPFSYTIEVCWSMASPNLRKPVFTKTVFVHNRSMLIDGIPQFTKTSLHLNRFCTQSKYVDRWHPPIYENQSSLIPFSYTIEVCWSMASSNLRKPVFTNTVFVHNWSMLVDGIPQFTKTSLH